MKNKYIEKSVWSSVRSSVWNSVRESVYSSVVDSVRNSVWSSIISITNPIRSTVNEYMIERIENE